MHVLIIEDDPRIADNLKIFLKEDDYQVTIANTFEDGLYLAEEETYDALIVDWMLPKGSGLEICRKIRAKSISTPILMLTAKSQVEDKVEGLTSGADDYLTKPFAKAELMARVKSLIRRDSTTKGVPVIKIKNLEINTNTTEVRVKDKKISLAPREYALLEYLALHKGEVIDRLSLLSHVWGEEVNDFSNTVDVHIRYLRKKIDQGKESLITTVKNKGYMLCEN